MEDPLVSRPFINLSPFSPLSSMTLSGLQGLRAHAPHPRIPTRFRAPVLLRLLLPATGPSSIPSPGPQGLTAAPSASPPFQPRFTPFASLLSGSASARRQNPALSTDPSFPQSASPEVTSHMFLPCPGHRPQTSQDPLDPAKRCPLLPGPPSGSPIHNASLIPLTESDKTPRHQTGFWTGSAHRLLQL